MCAGVSCNQRNDRQRGGHQANRAAHTGRGHGKRRGLLLFAVLCLVFSFAFSVFASFACFHCVVCCVATVTARDSIAGEAVSPEHRQVHRNRARTQLPQHCARVNNCDSSADRDVCVLFVVFVVRFCEQGSLTALMKTLGGKMPEQLVKRQIVQVCFVCAVILSRLEMSVVLLFGFVRCSGGPVKFCAFWFRWCCKLWLIASAAVSVR